MGAQIVGGGFLVLAAGFKIWRGTSVMRQFDIGGEELLQLLRSIEEGPANKDYLGYEVAILAHFFGAAWYLVMLAVAMFAVWFARRLKRADRVVWGYIEQLEQERDLSWESVGRGSEKADKPV